MNDEFWSVFVFACFCVLENAGGSAIRVLVATF
jgi:hypothetical protein